MHDDDEIGPFAGFVGHRTCAFEALSRLRDATEKDFSKSGAN
jgi:hypothetical protein